MAVKKLAKAVPEATEGPLPTKSRASHSKEPATVTEAVPTLSAKPLSAPKPSRTPVKRPAPPRLDDDLDAPGTASVAATPKNAPSARTKTLAVKKSSTSTTADQTAPLAPIKKSRAKPATPSTSSTSTKTAEKAAKKAQATGQSNGTAIGLYGITPYQPAKTEEYMSPEQLAHFKSILLAWKADLMNEVDRTVDYMQDQSAALPDVNDRATQEEEFAIKLRTRDRERKLIYKIEQSIKHIENEDYGYCDTCGIEIGLRRLEARPTASQCIDCKTLSEIKERQNHGS